MMVDLAFGGIDFAEWWEVADWVSALRHVGIEELKRLRTSEFEAIVDTMFEHQPTVRRMLGNVIMG